MKSAVKKWGSSAAVRIPTAIMNTIPLELGEMVDARAEAGRIVIRPVREKAIHINKLIKAITANNLHKPADFGPAAGKEVW